MKKKIHSKNISLRHGVQIFFFALTLAVGIQFAVFVYQAGHLHHVTVQRPPGVEGFLPIGALMGWKLFFLEGMWDPIHPAAMVILGLAALLSFGLRKSFCSWICPVGTLSEWLWRIGRRIIGRNIQAPKWIDLPLRSLKYALLGFFVWVIGQMDTQAIFGFLQSPYYKMSDVKMLHFFTRMSTLTGGVLILLTIGSIFMRNFWCRYLCPYGALMDIFSFFSPTRIRRCTDSCIDCGRCTSVCAYHLPVDQKNSVQSPECTGCLDCINSCPVKDALYLETIGISTNRWSQKGLGLVILVTFVLCIFTARITGHWQSQLDIREFRFHLQHIDAPHMTHPTVGKK